MAVGVAILLLSAIVAHWKTFGLAKEVVAFCLVANMFLQPPFRPRWSILNRLRKSDTDPNVLVLDGLANVLLVLVLFT